MMINLYLYEVYIRRRGSSKLSLSTTKPNDHKDHRKIKNLKKHDIKQVEPETTHFIIQSVHTMKFIS